jgi:glycosyltransferase involved in cell wall biosynthesis
MVTAIRSSHKHRWVTDNNWTERSSILEKLISIVIPAKNEEMMIAKCIEGAIKALKNIDSWEIILVDSYSTDRTVEIAKNYPIKILRLKKEWFKSPHAGRYIGSMNSSGRFIFFLDADMIVEEGWIEKALDTLQKDKSLAGVTGVMYDVFPDECLNKRHQIKHPLGYVEYMPGPSIYKKEILYNVKHFNPFLKGNGEKEFGFRILEKGYKQLRLDVPICYHQRKEYDLDEAFEKASYFIGVGQFLRLHFNMKNLIEALYKYRRVFSFMAALVLILILMVFSAITGNAYLFIASMTFILVPITLLLIKQKNPKKTFISINHWTLSSIFFFVGLFKKTRDSSDYPLEAEIIKPG